MRKIISILLLILFSFFAFAETQQSVVVVKATVSTISLSQALAASDGMLGLYKLTGGFDFDNRSATDYILADDISKNDITVYFRVDQLAKTRTEETIQISVTANRLVNSEATDILNQDIDAKIETGIPTISVVSCMDISALQVTSSPKNENEIIFTLHYMGYKPLENINIVTFKTIWDKTTGLAPGLYTSDVTLSYITN